MAIELVHIIAEAEYNGQVYSHCITCRAKDWDTHPLVRESYVAMAEAWVRQSLPVHVPVAIHLRRQTLEEDDA